MCFSFSLLLPHTDNNKCCPKIAGRDLTKDPPEDCFKVDGRFRYACKEGFVRKAGTSDLIKCSESNGSLRWTSASLQCIRKISMFLTLKSLVIRSFHLCREGGSLTEAVPQNMGTDPQGEGNNTDTRA